MNPSPQVREPRHLDLIINTGSQPATGYFSVVIMCEDGKFRSYPTLFLDSEDLDFNLLKSRISGSTVPNKICPIGTLKQIWKLDI